MFRKLRELKEGELLFKIMIPRKDPTSICPALRDDGEYCYMRLADTTRIEGPVCSSCKIVYEFVEDSLTQECVDAGTDWYHTPEPGTPTYEEVEAACIRAMEATKHLDPPEAFSIQLRHQENLGTDFEELDKVFERGGLRWENMHLDNPALSPAEGDPICLRDSPDIFPGGSILDFFEFQMRRRVGQGKAPESPVEPRLAERIGDSESDRESPPGYNPFHGPSEE